MKKQIPKSYVSYLREEPWNPKDMLLSQGAYFHGKSFSPISYVVPEYVQGQETQFF